MTEEKRQQLINNMTESLPILRRCLGLSQEELALKIGISRSTLAAIENKKREMSWNMFLSLMLFFIKHKETDKLLNVMDIYTDDFNQFIKDK